MGRADFDSVNRSNPFLTSCLIFAILEKKDMLRFPNIRCVNKTNQDENLNNFFKSR